MKKLCFVILTINLILNFGCKKDKDKVEEKQPITKNILTGLIQKGPFINGTTINIYELNESLSPTGKAYTTQIADNSGLFEIKNISLISQYVQLKADGYYFNEVTGVNSVAPITLYALADISNKTSINVNIISNLEKSRVEYLTSNGTSFSDAKKQAESEILKIFFIKKSDIIESELLDISKSGDNNAILLAISAILQGYRTEAELSELLANISTDIRNDGVLNTPTLGSALINDSKLFDLTKIRGNIEKRYLDLGMSVSIPNFEKYIKEFIDSSNYVFTNNIVYPEYSNYGENILYGNKTVFSTGLSMAANLPKGTSLKIIIKGGSWGYQAMPNGPINWTANQYENETQTFTAIESGKSCDLVFMWDGSGIHTIEFYENNSIQPTRVKTITN